MHLVMVDANVLVRDRDLSSPILRQLQALISDHPDAVRAAVTEVVIAEAVGRFVREADSDRRALMKLIERNHLGRLVSADAVEAAQTALEQRCDSYEDQLRGRLVTIGFEVLSHPEVSHAELVSRAVQRRRPNKPETGDGYRDTLNWFSLMQEADQLVAGDAVLWVTEDKDFWTKQDLHEALSAELSERAIECKVLPQRSIDEAVDHVQSAIDPEQKDTARVRAKLDQRSRTLEKFIAKQVLSAVADRPVSARSLALPRTAANVSIMVLADPVEEPEFRVAGAVEDGARVRATWVVPAIISYTDEVRLVSTDEVDDDDPVHTNMELHKDVLVVVDVVTDRDANPQNGTVTRVEATADDPGREAWAADWNGAIFEQIQRVVAASPQLRDLQRRQIELIQASIPETDVSSILGSAGVREQLGRIADMARVRAPRLDTSTLYRQVGEQLTRALRHVEPPDLTRETDNSMPSDGQDLEGDEAT